MMTLISEVPGTDAQVQANGKRWIKALFVWLALMAAEVVHGAVRTLWLAPAIGEFRARQVGVFTGSAIILAIVLLCVRWIGCAKSKFLIAVGIAWLALTLVFEIGLGHFAFGYSWQRIGEDYDILKGGLLPVGFWC